MGLIDYMQSQKISAAGDWSFQSLVMAAMRKADAGNLAKLEQVFPETLAELRKRYNAPGGALTDQEMEFVMRRYEASETEEEDDDEDSDEDSDF